jgi:hypothetical protein
VLREFVEHYHAKRNHQGLGNVIPFPSRDSPRPSAASADAKGSVACSPFTCETPRESIPIEIWDHTATPIRAICGRRIGRQKFRGPGASGYEESAHSDRGRPGPAFLRVRHNTKSVSIPGTSRARCIVSYYEGANRGEA